jgi:hypothetical protein
MAFPIAIRRAMACPISFAVFIFSGFAPRFDAIVDPSSRFRRGILSHLAAAMQLWFRKGA